MFLFMSAPTRVVSVPPPSRSSCIPGIAWRALARSPRSFFRSRTVHRLGYLDVMWSYFYKTAFLQRRTSFVTAVRPNFLWSCPCRSLVCHPHFMDERPPAPSHESAYSRVPLHPPNSISDTWVRYIGLVCTCLTRTSEEGKRARNWNIWIRRFLRVGLMRELAWLWRIIHECADSRAVNGAVALFRAVITAIR